MKVEKQTTPSGEEYEETIYLKGRVQYTIFDDPLFTIRIFKE